MKLKRRSFLKLAGAAAGAAMLAPSLDMAEALAAVNPKRRFIFAYFSGGWDTLLSLDPRDPNQFTGDRIGETLIQPAWEMIPANFPKTINQPSGSNIGFGPVVGEFARHFDVSCVVRGISMDTVTHEVGRRYFLTGLPPRGLTAAGSAAPTRIVAQQGDQTPIPNLVSRVESYNDNLPTFATGLAVNSVSDLVFTLSDLWPENLRFIREQVNVFRDGKVICDPADANRRGFMNLYQETQGKARDLLAKNLGQHFNFLDGRDAAMQKIRQRYSINSMDSGAAQAAMAFQALKLGIAQCVSIEIARNLDTHDDNWSDDQPNNQAAGWNALATLVNDLKNEPHPDGGTLIEHTTILVWSEFGRTALLNVRNGRDHSLSSSCVLIGAGVPHNKVIGKTTDRGMNPAPVDPVTGIPQDTGVTITPPLVLASIMQSAELNTDKLRVQGLPCLMA
ncbi:MAG: hypothetical protein GMKNLPBB_02207 [Myxococcota bacterium]|nr:hypothetical protein [Myxococcota bacterium]